jgi:putative restriction endonuclease
LSPALPPTLRTRLEKAALDNGFDQELPGEGEWLGFASTKSPLWIWLSAELAARPVVAFSQLKVATALAPSAREPAVAMPLGARAVLVVDDVPALHGLLRRAFQLSRTLPEAPLRRFEARTRNLPQGTEMERLVVQRIGQDMFREDLLEYWDGRCAVTGLAVPALLHASHIKPWADCETDAERLDVFNGLLLAPNLDAAFDAGFVTVQDDSAVTVSPVLCREDRGRLGFDGPMRVSGLADGHRRYLPWHRAKVFRGLAGP